MKLFFIFLSLLLTPEAFAHEEGEKKTEEIRILKTIDINDKSKAYIVAREDGHILGQPYQVEMRLNCEGKEMEVKDLPVQDSLSVCDIDPESLKVNNQKTAVAMKTKLADMNSYYDEVEKGNTLATVKCLKKTKILKFTLKNLCP